MNKYYVCDITIRATTKCDKEFSCLEGSRQDLCSVKYCINRGISFVECANDNNCYYKTSYGDGMICLCPVRNELYNKYKI